MSDDEDDDAIFSPAVQQFINDQIKDYLGNDLTLKYNDDSVYTLTSAELCRLCRNEIKPQYIEQVMDVFQTYERIQIEDAGEIVGYLICENRIAEGGAWKKLHGFMGTLHLICTKYTGKKLGTLLMTAFLLAMNQKRYDHILLGASNGRANKSAYALYRKFGFAPRADLQDCVGDDSVAMYLNLAAVDGATIMGPLRKEMPNPRQIQDVQTRRTKKIKKGQA